MSQPIRILLADDQPLIRHALRTLLDGESDLEIVGEAGNFLETIQFTRLLQPDLVLLDLALCDDKCAELLASLHRQQPAVRIVILTTIEDEEVIAQALQAGVAGYLLKSVAPYDLIQALRAAIMDGVPLHPRIASRVLRRLNHPPAKSQAKLTAREQEILQLLAQGYTNQEVARKLVITQFTVRSHVCRILKKLNLANRTQAALYLIRCQQSGGCPSEVPARSEG